MKKIKQRNIIKVRFFVIGMHIVFIFAQLYLYSIYISKCYAQQHNVQKQAILEHEKQEALKKLCIVQDLSNIKKFAKTELNMHKININAIRRIAPL